jgi:MFS transporter, DHA2 family, metal-tetracycline-proton antiporter
MSSYREVKDRMQSAVRTQEKTAGAKASLVQALCFVLFFSVMNATMFNVALPDIASSFRLSPSSVSWIVTGYSIIYALGSLMYGKLADKYPLKRLITIGLLMFAAGSALGFFAHTYPLVLAARFIQAAGASCVPALVMLIPVRFFPPEQRGRVMGVIASTIAFSSGVGPIVGGFIAGHFSWNSLFLISLAAPVVLPFIRTSLPNEDVRAGEKIDLIGAGSLGAAVSTFMLSVTQFNFWWLLASAALFSFFFLRTQKVSNPFIRLSLFRLQGFRSGLIIGFLAMFTVFGIFLTTPIMLHHLHQLSAQAIGLTLFPAAMAAALMGRVGGKLVDRRGSKYTLFVAFSLLSFGLLALSVVTGLSVVAVACALLFVNSSFTFVQSALAKVVSSALPKEQTGIGMGIYNLTNFLAGAISGAVMSKTVEFDWSRWNVLAVQHPSTYGTIYFLLAALAGLNMWLIHRKLESNGS